MKGNRTIVIQRKGLVTKDFEMSADMLHYEVLVVLRKVGRSLIAANFLRLGERRDL